MYKNGINLNLCRLCGFKNENGLCLSDEDNAELLAKVQETFSPLICKDDPFPKKVCIQCQRDVNIFFNKIKRFRSLESRWCDSLKGNKPNHPYFDLISMYDKSKANLLEEIVRNEEQLRIEAENDQDPFAEIPDVKNVKQNDKTITSNDEHTKTTTVKLTDDELLAKNLEIQRNRIKRRRQSRFSGYVRSRALRNKHKKVIKVKNEITETSTNNDQANRVDSSSIVENESDNTSYRTDLSYKKFRNPCLEIITQNEILDSRTRTNRRTIQPFVYDYHQLKSNHSSKSTTANNKISDGSKAPRAKTPLPTKPNEETANSSTTAESPSRKRRRINYSEELFDEAFMYEQMLDDKQHKEKRQNNSKTSNKNSSSTDVGNIDSRLRLLEQRNEISIVPVKSGPKSKIEKKSATLKSEPLFNITSSVSVHIKPRKSDTSTSEQAIPIIHIRRCQNGYETTAPKKGLVACKKCNQKCDDLKALAVHQLTHLTISTHRIDGGKILHPRLRRGRMLTIANEHFLRCVNCSKLHSNNKSILDHWNNGECLFYCWICGKSFHDEKINELDAHFENEHGIKRRDPMPTLPSAPPIKRIETIATKVEIKNKVNSNPENVCTLCNRKFTSRQALSTHLTYHEKKISQPKELSAINLERKKIGSKRTVNPVALATKISNAMQQRSESDRKNSKSVKVVPISHSLKEHLTGQVTQKLPSVPTTSTPIRKPQEPSSRPINKKKAKKSSKSSKISGKIPSKVMSNPNVTIKRVRPLPDSPPKSNPDVSSTTDRLDELQIVKSEPIDDYQEFPTENGFGGLHIPLPMPESFDEWDQRVDSSVDTSPRLKVKNLMDLQAPQQLFSLDTHSFVQTHQTQQKDQLIMSNGNVSGLQIQNVQSYHTQAMPMLQSYAGAGGGGDVDHLCANGIDTNLNLSNGFQSSSMCQPNLYDMHMGHPVSQPISNTQLINPVYLLQQSSSHGPY